jgi:hypothetical protein
LRIVAVAGSRRDIQSIAASSCFISSASSRWH